MLEDHEPKPHRPPSPGREPAPSKPLAPDSRSKKYPQGITSVTDRNPSTGGSSGQTPGITRTVSASPRRPSLFSPDPALADVEDETGGRRF